MLFSEIKVTLCWPKLRLRGVRDHPFARKIHRGLDQTIHMLAATTRVKGSTVIAIHAAGIDPAQKTIV